VLRFGERMELVQTGDAEADSYGTTAAFTRAIEDAVRRNPEQWLWMHRRWKTRPAGEQGVY
jgi:KDO2-lipid IV(A) lauroyltransferase